LCKTDKFVIFNNKILTYPRLGDIFDAAVDITFHNSALTGNKYKPGKFISGGLPDK